MHNKCISKVCLAKKIHLALISVVTLGRFDLLHWSAWAFYFHLNHIGGWTLQFHILLLKLETLLLNHSAGCLDGKLCFSVTETEKVKEDLVDQTFIYSLQIKDSLESNELCFPCGALNP